MRRILILGATGSIGRQALDVVQRDDDLEVVGLSAATSWSDLVEAATSNRVGRIALTDAYAAEAAAGVFGGEVLAGEMGIVELISSSGADMVLNAIVGGAGLGPTVATLTEGIDLALANKESLVLGGELVMQLAEATGAKILPVDSEHSALFQLIASESPGRIDRLVLTASGGPFRGYGRAELSDVGVKQALDHPTWSMGSKITLDSATLMNKGLELIEAHHLFGVPYDRIDVLVHRQSIVHSLVHLDDGASLAHLGYPDMRVPISFALNYPDRVDVPVETLDLAKVGRLDFEAPDLDAFKCLKLARQAGETGGSAPGILNASGEVASAAFLDGRIGFLEIAEVVEATLQSVPSAPVGHFEELFRADHDARQAARGIVSDLVSRQPA